MIIFTVRRLFAAVLTAFAASVLAFFLFWTVPNVDPAFWLGGNSLNVARKRAMYCCAGTRRNVRSSRQRS